MTTVGDISFRLDEEVLRNILKVDKEGFRSVADKSFAKGFLIEAGEIPNLNTSAKAKKFLKGLINSTLSL